MLFPLYVWIPLWRPPQLHKNAYTPEQISALLLIASVLPPPPHLTFLWSYLNISTDGCSAPRRTSTFCYAWKNFLRRKNITMCEKYFPSYDRTSNDSEGNIECCLREIYVQLEATSQYSAHSFFILLSSPCSQIKLESSFYAVTIKAMLMLEKNPFEEAMIVSAKWKKKSACNDSVR